MIKFDCVVNCGTDNAAFPKFIGKVQNFSDLKYSFDSEKTFFQGVVENKTFINFLSLLDSFKFYAKVKKKILH